MRTLSPMEPEGPAILRPASNAYGWSNSYLLLGQDTPRQPLRWRGFLWKACLPLAFCALVALLAASLRSLGGSGDGDGGGVAAAGRLGRGPATAVTQEDEEKKSELPTAPWRCIPDGHGGWRCRLPAKAHHKEHVKLFNKSDLEHEDWSPEFSRDGHEKHSEKSEHHKDHEKKAEDHDPPEKKSSKNDEHEPHKKHADEGEKKSHAHHEDHGKHAHHEEQKEKHAQHEEHSEDHGHPEKQTKKKHADSEETKEEGDRHEERAKKEHAHQEDQKKEHEHSEDQKKEHEYSEEGEKDKKHDHDHESSDGAPEAWMGRHALGDDREEQQASDGQPPQNPWQSALSTAAGAWGGFVSGAKNVLHIPTETVTSTDSTTSTTSQTATLTTTRTATATVTSTSTETVTTSVTTTSTATATVTTTWTATTTTTTTRLATLFCFEVMRTSGFEVDLVKGQWKNNASIFACEEYALYSHGGVVQVGAISSSEITAAEITKGNLSKAGTTTNSWLNTRLFQEAWKRVLKSDKWWNHAWTVKVDPDAVFFPHRLRKSLLPYYPAGIKDGPALLVGNCDRTWHNEPKTLKLFGALEVFSRNAMGMYKAFSDRCIKELDWEGWGEDYFMQRCLKLLQVEMVDGVSFAGDNRCHGAPCGDTSKVFFHAYKDTQRYFDCWGESRAAEGLVHPR